MYRIYQIIGYFKAKLIQVSFRKILTQQISNQKLKYLHNSTETLIKINHYKTIVGKIHFATTALGPAIEHRSKTLVLKFLKEELTNMLIIAKVKQFFHAVLIMQDQFQEQFCRRKQRKMKMIYIMWQTMTRLLKEYPEMSNMFLPIESSTIVKIPYSLIKK